MEAHPAGQPPTSPQPSSSPYTKTMHTSGTFPVLEESMPIKSSNNGCQTGVFVGHAIRHSMNSAPKPGAYLIRSQKQITFQTEVWSDPASSFPVHELWVCALCPV